MAVEAQQAKENKATAKSFRSNLQWIISKTPQYLHDEYYGFQCEFGNAMYSMFYIFPILALHFFLFLLNIVHICVHFIGSIANVVPQVQSQIFDVMFVHVLWMFYINFQIFCLCLLFSHNVFRNGSIVSKPWKSLNLLNIVLDDGSVRRGLFEALVYNKEELLIFSTTYISKGY